MKKPETSEEIRNALLNRLYDEWGKGNEPQSLRDVAAGIEVEHQYAVREARYLKGRRLIDGYSSDLGKVKILQLGIEYVERMRSSESYMIPEFYNKPIPKGRKERKELLQFLNERLATSQPGSPDWILTKEKAGQVIYENSQTNRKTATVLTIIALVIAALAIVGSIVF